MIVYWKYSNKNKTEHIFARDTIKKRERLVYDAQRNREIWEFWEEWEDWESNTLKEERILDHGYKIVRISKKEANEIMFLDRI